MAVVSKSTVSASRRHPNAKAVAIASGGAASVKPPTKRQSSHSNKSGHVPIREVAPVKFASKTLSMPLWLRSLLILQRRSSLVTFALVATTLALYGWTVYSQQVWSQAYRKLETLQRNERKLTTTGEVLKNQMAQQAELPDAGLVPPTPATAIFLPSAPARPAPTALNPTAPQQAPQPKPTPLGY